MHDPPPPSLGVVFFGEVVGCVCLCGVGGGGSAVREGSCVFGVVLVVCVLGYVLVFGVLVDDVECVLGALLCVEYGAGEDFGGFGEVFEGVDGGGWWGFRGLGDEVAVGGDDLVDGFGLGCSGSSWEV